MMQMSQMNGFDSSRSPAEKPSTGLFFRPARGRRHRRFRVGVAAVGAAVASGARDGGGGGRARAFQLLHQHDGALAAVRGRGARARLAVCAAGCLARGGHGAGREECAPRPSPVARRRGRRLGRARTRAVSAESGTLRPAGALVPRKQAVTAGPRGGRWGPLLPARPSLRYVVLILVFFNPFPMYVALKKKRSFTKKRSCTTAHSLGKNAAARPRARPLHVAV